MLSEHVLEERKKKTGEKEGRDGGEKAEIGRGRKAGKKEGRREGQHKEGGEGLG